MANGTRPRDEYDAYFAEKIWSLLPPVHRHEDGIGDRPGVLRAFVEILATQAAVLRRDEDRVWDDFFIDLCDDWVVPYIGDLVDTRLISALDRRGRRIDVAKTIYYRRRKGTLRVLEELIGDITAWDGTVTESFRGLARSRHALDPVPGPLAARFSGTMPGGWADLRRAFAASLTDGPFDEYAHTPDIRHQRAGSRAGRWNIPTIVFHLYRLISFHVVGATPVSRAGGPTFLFDPSGRDISLFAPRHTVPDWDAWRMPRLWELPVPIPCELLGHAEYVITDRLIADLVAVLTGAGQPAVAADELKPFVDQRFRSEDELRTRLAALPSSASLLIPPVYRAILDGAIVIDCGKFALLPAAIEVDIAPGSPVPTALTTAANLRDWSATGAGKDLLIDAERGRFKLLGAASAGPVTVNYCYGFLGEVGAGPYDRREAIVDLTTLAAQKLLSGGGPIAAADMPADGGLQLDDSATYGPLKNKAGVKRLVIQAANFNRPYVRLDANWKITAAAGGTSTLFIDGLWIGSGANRTVEIAGAWDQVTIRQLTLDPGGTDADGNLIGTMTLLVSGQVRELVVQECIVGPISTAGTGVIDALILRDSIVQSRNATAAIALAPGRVRLERVTVIGDIAVERLSATETLVLGTVNVDDTQEGCFRFSAASVGSRLPRPFASHELADLRAIVVSTTFGDPHYVQLSDAAPRVLLRGAEDGSEIGAFSGLNAPIRLDGLRAKVEEFLPFGLIPLFLFET